MGCNVSITKAANHIAIRGGACIDADGASFEHGGRLLVGGFLLRKVQHFQLVFMEMYSCSEKFYAFDFIKMF